MRLTPVVGPLFFFVSGGTAEVPDVALWGILQGGY
jgi:hypothetical protein